VKSTSNATLPMAPIFSEYEIQLKFHEASNEEESKPIVNNILSWETDKDGIKLSWFPVHDSLSGKVADVVYSVYESPNDIFSLQSLCSIEMSQASALASNIKEAEYIIPPSSQSL
jgi:hypothetical protein